MMDLHGIKLQVISLMLTRKMGHHKLNGNSLFTELTVHTVMPTANLYIAQH